MTRPSAYRYRFELPASVEESFELFSNPHLLNALTPAWFELEPIGEPPEVLAVGAEIRYRLRWRGIPLRWTSRIVQFERPHLLTYEQARGPYLAFRHEHRFRGGPSATEVDDRVVYRARGGRLVDRFVVRPDLERIFRFRSRKVHDLLAANRSAQPLAGPRTRETPKLG